MLTHQPLQTDLDGRWTDEVSIPSPAYIGKAPCAAAFVVELALPHASEATETATAVVVTDISGRKKSRRASNPSLPAAA